MEWILYCIAIGIYFYLGGHCHGWIEANILAEFGDDTPALARFKCFLIGLFWPIGGAVAYGLDWWEGCEDE